jgi:hypothetical protein
MIRESKQSENPGAASYACVLGAAGGLSMIVRQQSILQGTAYGCGVVPRVDASSPYSVRKIHIVVLEKPA